MLVRTLAQQRSPGQCLRGPPTRACVTFKIGDRTSRRPTIGDRTVNIPCCVGCGRCTRRGCHAQRENPHAAWDVAPGRSPPQPGIAGELQIAGELADDQSRPLSRQASTPAAGQQARIPQHSTIFTASPPRAVSLYLIFISAPVCIMVLITLSRLTVCSPSP